PARCTTGRPPRRGHLVHAGRTIRHHHKCWPMSTHVAEASATGRPRPTLLCEGAELNHSMAPSATYTSRSTASAADIGPEILPGFLSLGRSTSQGGARPVLERRGGGAKRRSGGVKNRAQQGPTPRDAERLQNYSPPLRGWPAP